MGLWLAALGFGAAGLACARAENVRVEMKAIGAARGEAAPTPVVQFQVGEASYRALATPGWKWVADAAGFDAAALGPGQGFAVIGVRVERLRDAAGKEIARMGRAAHAALKARWDAEAQAGTATVTSWEGGPDAEELTVRFRRQDSGRELEGCERSFFAEGRLVTLGLLCDARQETAARSMFAQFNGSFAKVEP